LVSVFSSGQAYNCAVQLVAPRALDVDLARDSTQRRGLIVELIAYLRQRQAAIGLSVTQHTRQANGRATAHERRHDAVVDRLARIEGRLERLDEEVGEGRVMSGK